MNRSAPVQGLRILMTADAVGGVWTYALELARALAPHGVEIALATMGGAVSGEQRAAVASLPNVALFEGDYRLEWMDDPWTDVDRAGDWLLGVAAEFRPDVVHLNGYAHGSLSWGAPVLMVAHSCVLSWWRAVKGGPAPAGYDGYRRRVREGLAAADFVVAPSEAMRTSLAENYGVPPGSAVIKPAAKIRVDGDLRAPLIAAQPPDLVATALRRRVVDAARSPRRSGVATESQALRAANGARPSPSTSGKEFRRGTIYNACDHGRFAPAAVKQPRILSAGRAWDEAKNVAALEAVAPRVGWPIEIAGDITHPNGGVPAGFVNVRCLGMLSPGPMSERLATSAIYALPARYEPFGLSVLEAGLSGCALVLGDIPSLREIWGDAARFVAPDDADGLARTLNDLIADDARRTAMGRRARRRALDFSPRQMAEEYLAVYRDLLAQRTTEAMAA